MATSRSTRPSIPGADSIPPSPRPGAKSKRKDVVSGGSRSGEARGGNGAPTAGRHDAAKDETPAPEQAASGSGHAPEPGGERLSDEERQRRIAEAAYRKAEDRGFRGDSQLDDWLEAEREHNNGAKRAG